MKVFISYSMADAELAQRVVKYLKASGFQVWDDSEVLPGDNWGEILAKALQESDAMVVLLTPNSVHSPNLTFEVSYALGSKDYKGRVIPVLAASPDQLPQAEIPWVLRRFQMLRLSTDLEDTGADGLSSIAQALQQAA
jgi:hypothetical protein